MADEQLSVEIGVEAKAALAALQKLTNSIDSLEKQTVQSNSKMGKAFASFAGNLAAIGVSKAIGFATDALYDFGVGSVKAAASFEKAVKEINTILPKNTKLTEDQTNSLRELAKQYGTSAASQAKAYYAVVSAGVTDAAEATELLSRANELAIGGLTSTEASIDILTSAINAYGKENVSAQGAADSLFTAVQLGKTTVDQLASSLGLAIPSAKAAGVSLDLLNASVATLTTKGFSTNIAVTRMNALFTSFARNNASISKVVDNTALANGDLVKVLQDLEKATGGNSTKLLELLGSQEAVQAAQTLMENGAKSLTDTFGKFADKTGASTDAFNEMGESAEVQFGRLTAQIEDLQISLGNKLLPVLVEAGKWLNDALGGEKPRTELQKVQDELAKQEQKLVQLKTVYDQFKESGSASSVMLQQQSNAVNLQANAVQKLIEKERDLIRAKGTGKKKEVPASESTSPMDDPRILNEEIVLSEIEQKQQAHIFALMQMNAEADAQKQQMILADKEITLAQREEAINELYAHERAKLEVIQSAELTKNQSITDAEERALADSLARRKYELSMIKNHADQEKAINDSRVANREQMVAGFARALEMASQLTKRGTEEYKALSIASATISTYRAATRAMADYPFPANLAVAAATVASGLNQVANIQKQSFATGGVVGGFSGASMGMDNQTANVRTGEMILNANQQRQLFDVANGKESNNVENKVIEITSIVQVDEREIARAVRNQKLEGFTV